MIVPDANLLLYAYDSTSPFHDRASRWWAHCLSESEPVGLCHPVVFAFLRIGTNARVFSTPMTLSTARGHIESWFSRAITRPLIATLDHHAKVIELLEQAGSAGGNLVTDAQIAAIAKAHGAEVHTADRDFARFPGLRCRYPLDSQPLSTPDAVRSRR